MKRGRTNYLRLLGADQRALFEAAVKGASVVLHQRIARDGETLVEATVKVAFVAGGRARPIPKALRAAMAAGQDSQRGC